LAKSSGIIQVFVRPAFQQALRRRAQELGLTEAEAAARLVEQGLEPFLEDTADTDQALAERQLLDLAGELAREEVEKASEWNRRLTFTVFERIRNEHKPLYDRAVSGGHRDAVNPRVARQIKTAVGAEVEKRDGRPVTLKVPRGSNALISNYTALKEPD
jgi:hypothetical protein